MAVIVPSDDQSWACVTARRGDVACVGSPVSCSLYISPPSRRWYPGGGGTARDIPCRSTLGGEGKGRLLPVTGEMVKVMTFF